MSEQRCRHAVLLRGNELPCDALAVGLRVGVEDNIYPVCALHTRQHLMIPLDYVERRAEARAFKAAARVAESEAEEQWRNHRGEGIPGGVSVLCAQVAAQELGKVARVLSDRAWRKASGNG